MKRRFPILFSLLIFLGLALAMFSSLAFNNQWISVSIPGGVTQLRDFAIVPSDGHICLADRLSGFWCNGSQVNTGLPTSSGNVLGWTITWDATHSQLIAGLCGGTGHPSYWRSTNEGSSWTNIFTASSGTCPNFTGVVITGNGTIIFGIQNGSAGTCGAFYSTDGGSTVHASSCPANGTAPAPGGTWSLYWNAVTSVLWLGTEQAGIYFSTDNGATFTPCSPPDENFLDGNGIPGIRDGDVDGMGNDSSGLMLMAAQGGVWKQVTSTSTCGTNSFTNTYGNVSGHEPGRMISPDANNNLYYGHGQWSGDPITLNISATGNVNSFSAFAAGLPTVQEAWKILTNPVDGQLYVYIQNGSGTPTNAGYLFRTLATSQLTPSPVPPMFAWLLKFIRKGAS